MFNNAPSLSESVQSLEKYLWQHQPKLMETPEFHTLMMDVLRASIVTETLRLVEKQRVDMLSNEVKSLKIMIDNLTR